MFTAIGGDMSSNTMRVMLNVGGLIILGGSEEVAATAGVEIALKEKQAICLSFFFFKAGPFFSCDVGAASLVKLSLLDDFFPFDDL